MKKVLSLFLAIVMVAAICVTAIPTVFAEVKDTDYFKIGDTGYATLKDALTAAKDGDTIEMLKDFTDETADNLGNYSVDVTINGNGYTYTKTGNSNKYFFVIIDGSVVTINNLKLRAASGIIVRNGTLNLNDCDFITTYRMCISTDGGSTQTINVHNTYMEITTTSGQPLILFNSATNVFNATGDTTLVRSTGVNTDNTGNRSVINIGANCTDTTINLGSKTELVINQANDANYSAVGIHDGGKGTAYYNFEKGFLIRVNTNCAKTEVFTGVNTLNRYVTFAGASLIKNSETILLNYTQGANMAGEVFKWAANDTVVEENYTTYDLVPATDYAANTVMYLDANGAKQTTTDLATAISAERKAGSRIYLLADYTAAAKSQMFKFNKNTVVDGNGFSMLLKANDNVSAFPFYVEGNNIAVEIRNFELINSGYGGFEVKEGELTLSYLEAKAHSRVVLKTTPSSGKTAHAIVEKADLKIASAVKDEPTDYDANVTWQYGNQNETALIMNNGGIGKITLKDGAVISKENISNDSVNAAGALIYTGTDGGAYTINMEKGSKMIANHASGTKGSLFASNCNSPLNVTIDEGAYVMLDSNLTSEFWFVYSLNTKNTTINAYDGAFLVKEGVTTTLKDFIGGPQNDKNVYYYEALATSPVSGYTAYKMTPYTFVVNDGAAGAKTIAAAISAVTADGTIVQKADYSGSESELNFNKKLTWDLNGKVYTTTANSYLGSINSEVTVKNGILKVAGGLQINNNGNLTFNGVTATVNNSGTYARPLIKLSGDKQNDKTDTATFTAINSILTTNSTNSDGQALILVEQAINGTVDLTGTTKLVFNGLLIKNPQNCALIAIQEAYSFAANQNPDLGYTNATINVGSNVKIIANHGSNASSTIAASLIADNTKGDVTVNLEAGATMEMVRTNIQSSSKSYFINPIYTDGTTTVNDNGANFVIGKDALATGVILPTLSNADATFVGYELNDKVYAGGDTVKATVDDEKVSLNTVYYTDEDFDLVYGASLRTVQNSNGIRFSTFITDELLADLGGKDNVVFGTIIAPGTATADDPNAHASKLTIVSSENFQKDFKGYEDKNVYNAAVIFDAEELGVTEKDIYELYLVARSYFTVTYADGETATFYTTVGDDNIRSMLYVAQNLNYESANADVQEVIDHIVSTCAD